MAVKDNDLVQIWDGSKIDTKKEVGPSLSWNLDCEEYI